MFDEEFLRRKKTNLLVIWKILWKQFFFTLRPQKASNVDSDRVNICRPLALCVFLPSPHNWTWMAESSQFSNWKNPIWDSRNFGINTVYDTPFDVLITSLNSFVVTVVHMTAIRTKHNICSAHSLPLDRQKRIRSTFAENLLFNKCTVFFHIKNRISRDHNNVK